MVILIDNVNSIYLNEINNLRKELNDLHVESLNNIFKDNIEIGIYNDTINAIENKTRDVFALIENDSVCAVATVHYEISKETFDKYSKKTYYIDELMVSTKHQKSGFGRQMIDYLKQDAYKKGYENISLDVWNFNKNAIDFYEKIGFIPLNTIMTISTK